MHPLAAAPIVLRTTDTAAIVLGALGVGLSSVALAWQALSYILSGPRVRVTLSEGLRAPMGNALIGLLDAYPDETRTRLEQDGYDQRVAVVVAVNRGRMPATINGWGIKFGNRAFVAGPVAGPLNPNNTIPLRLEPAADATWFLRAEDLTNLQAQFIDQSDEAARVRAEVRVAGREDAVRSRYTFVARGDALRFIAEPWWRRALQKIV